MRTGQPFRRLDTRKILFVLIESSSTFKLCYAIIRPRFWSEFILFQHTVVNLRRCFASRLSFAFLKFWLSFSKSSSKFWKFFRTKKYSANQYHYQKDIFKCHTEYKEVCSIYASINIVNPFLEIATNFYKSNWGWSFVSQIRNVFFKLCKMVFQMKDHLIKLET